MPLTEAKALFEEERQKSLEWLQSEIGSLRSNRVKPDLILNIPVEAYGSRSQLQSLASVSSSDARTLVVSPYDKNMMIAIEKALTDANLGVNPTVEGEIIRITFPSMTDDVRQQTLKVLHNKAEEARVRLRQGRDEALRVLKREKEDGDITEDDFYSGKEALDADINAANKEVEDLAAKKEADISTV